MEYTRLGRSGLSVSRLCLGTMNFGPETTEPDSHEIMDRAHEHGVNFFDTAKMVNGAVVSASLLHPARSAAECHPPRSEGLARPTGWSVMRGLYPGAVAAVKPWKVTTRQTSPPAS